MKTVNDSREFALEMDEERREVRSEAVFDRRWMLLVTGIVVFGLGCAIDAFLPRTVHGAPAAPAAAVAPRVASAATLTARPTSVSGVVEAAAPVARPATRDPRGHRIVTKCIGAGPVTFSDQPCGEGVASEHVAVDPEQNVADGLLPSQVVASAAPAGTEDAPVASARPDPATLHRHQCDALEARIKAIEEQSGEAVAMGTQERLSALRREYRDAQYRMLC